MLRTVGKKISIIIPVYNAEPYLIKCLNSIISQSYSDLQIIIIDDGSNDNSGKICDRYALEDRRIEVFHTTNQGSVAARKLGIKHAAGEYIGFVDADDYIDNNMFELLLEDICESGADFVHTGYFEETNGKSEYVYDFADGIYDLKNLKQKTEFLTEYVLKPQKGSFISSGIWSKLFTKDLISKCFLFLPDEQQYGEDLLCLCLCVLESRRIMLRKSALYHYVVYEKSLSHIYGTKKVIQETELGYNIINLLKTNYKSAFHYLEDAITYFIQKRFLDLINNRKHVDVCISYFYIKDISPLRGKNIIIYGAGAVGRDYYSQICRYKDIEIVAWLDSDYSKCSNVYTCIQGIESLDKYVFDIILVAVQNKDSAETIMGRLIEYGQQKEKILWIMPAGVLECV